MAAGSFTADILTADIAAIRKHARQKMGDGPLTESWVRYTGHATRRLLEDILADEEEQADDLGDLLGA